jgi:DNA polymerase-3 subunit beta
LKFTVSNADLLRELTLLSSIVSRKPTIPVLANVLIRAAGGSLLFVATDLEVGLLGACTATVEEEGSITLPAGKLADLVKAQSGPQSTIMINETGTVKFTSGRFNSRLQSLPSRDFPGIPVQPPSDGAITLPRERFRLMVEQVRYATAEGGGNDSLKGAILTFPAGGFTLASTDTSRMSYTTTEREGPELPSIVLPNKTLDEVKSLLTTGEPTFTFNTSDRHMFFDSDGRLLISRQMDAKAPDFKRILERGDGLPELAVDRMEWLACLRRSVLVSDIVNIKTDATGLHVVASSQDVGEAVEEVPVDVSRYTGPNIFIRVRGRYLLDFLEQATSQTITIAQRDSSNPLFLRDGGFTNVVMGMRI